MCEEIIWESYEIADSVSVGLGSGLLLDISFFLSFSSYFFFTLHF